MQPTVPHDETDRDARLRYWSARLGRLRLGAEPIEEQLERYRRVTLVLTDISAALAVFFVGLFAAFRRPGIGAVLAAVLLLPIVAVAWSDYLRLRGLASAYREEMRGLKTDRLPDEPGGNEASPPA